MHSPSTLHQWPVVLSKVALVALVACVLTASVAPGAEPTAAADRDITSNTSEKDLTLVEQAKLEVEAVAEMHGEGSPPHIQALGLLVFLQDEAGDTDGALTTMRRFAELAAEAFGERSDQSLAAWAYIAVALRGNGEFDEALKAYQRVLDSQLAKLGPKHPDTLETQLAMAEVLAARGDSQEAYDILVAMDTVNRETATLAPYESLELLDLLSRTSLALGKHEPAQAALQRLINLAEAADTLAQVPVDDVAQFATTAHIRLREFYQAEERFEEELAMRQRNHAFLARLHDEVPALSLQVLSQYAIISSIVQNYSDAAEAYFELSSRREEQLGPDALATLSAKRELAAAYRKLGQLAKAEALLRDTHRRYEAVLGATNPRTVLTLGELAETLAEQGRRQQADQLYRRAVALGREALASPSNDAAKLRSAREAAVIALSGVDETIQARSPYAELSETLEEWELTMELEELDARATSGAITASGNPGDAVLPSPEALANGVDPQAMEEAFAAFQGMSEADRASYMSVFLAVWRARSRDRVEDSTQIFGAESVPTAVRRCDFGNSLLGSAMAVFVAGGAPEEANGYLQTADETCAHGERLLTRLQGEAAREAIDCQLCRANAAFMANRAGDFLLHARATTRAVERAIGVPDRAHALADDLERGALVRTLGLLEDPYLTHLRALESAVRAGVVTQPAAADEALEVAQRALTRKSARAQSQVAARLVAGDAALSSLVRKRQDAALAWQEIDDALVASLSKAPGERNPALETALRQQKAGAESSVVEADGVLRERFPNYTKIVSPQPLSVADVQALLAPGEVLVITMLGPRQALFDQTFLLGVSRDRAIFGPIPIAHQQLAAEVAAIRADIKAMSDRRAGAVLAFDLEAAHTLFRWLVAPLAPVLEDADHIVFVLDGPLQALPPSLLVTETPPVISQPSDYRNVAWLIDDMAVTVVPSVNALRASRQQSGRSQAPYPFFGIGDPLLPGHPSLATAESPPSPFRGLQPIPETGTEIVAIATAFGAEPTEHTLLRDRATEARLRRARLTDYRVLTFATHGIMAAQDAPVRSEAGLVLTPDADDDGFLSTSEVAALELDADWVVLSACNTGTAAEDESDVSALARAFLYAGARSLLISHWYVSSDSARRLVETTLTDPHAADRPAFALQEAMRLVRDETFKEYAHPYYWSPFTVFGGVAQ